jgi:2-methylcitrate dehydratase PrpD
VRVMRGHDPSLLTKGLGVDWEFRATVLKPYASCRFTHGPVEALRGCGLDAARIASVEIATFRTSCEVSDRPDPKDATDAILSHQVAAALALLRRPILPAAFRTLDASVRELAAKVRVRHDPSLDAAYPARWPHRMTITMSDGAPRILMSERPPAADHAATRDKFLALVSPVLGAGRADELAAMIAGLESLPDARALARLFRPDLAQAA